ncbi:MAG: class IV adenylate cyclase [Crenarchaeota archaeon]|nr:class IV adenylate cyclase [Thermoproteota archaeon]
MRPSGQDEEIEAKYKVICSDEQIKQLIEAIGASYIEVLHEYDTYLQHPCKDFSQTDEALRLRMMIVSDREKWILTYKGPRKMSGEIKSREEIEVELTEPEKILKILNRLGFKKIASITKKRYKYRYNDCDILLDHVKGLGVFLEIECRRKNEINKVKELIGSCIEPVYKTYLELCFETGVCHE